MRAFGSKSCYALELACSAALWMGLLQSDLLEALWAAAQMYPDWHDAAAHLNAVMIRRHVGGMAPCSGQSQFIGVGNTRFPHSTVTRKDLVNICDWQKNHSVKVHDHDVSNLETELALVQYCWREVRHHSSWVLTCSSSTVLLGPMS